MLLRVKLVGSGTPQDANRVDLPTYTLIHGNVTQGYAIVSVPDSTLGVTDKDLESEHWEETTEGRLYTSPSPTLLDKIHEHYDKAYPRKPQPFRIQPV
jgi:hypothetical protein